MKYLTLLLLLPLTTLAQIPNKAPLGQPTAGASLSTTAIGESSVVASLVSLSASFDIKDPAKINEHPLIKALRDPKKLEIGGQLLPLESAETSISVWTQYENDVPTSRTALNVVVTADKKLTGELIGVFLEFQPKSLSDPVYLPTPADYITAQQAALENGVIKASTQLSTIFTALQKTSSVKLKLAPFYQIKATPVDSQLPRPVAMEMAFKTSPQVTPPSNLKVTAEVEISQVVTSQ